MLRKSEVFIDKLDVSDKYKEELKNLGFECVNDVLLYLVWDRLGGTLEVDQPANTSWNVDTENAGWR